eukprot:1673828-Amphidinium_carterae.1
MAGQPNHGNNQDAQRRFDIPRLELPTVDLPDILPDTSNAQGADSGRGIRRRRETKHDPPHPTRRLTHRHRWDPVLQTYVRSTSNSPRSNFGNTQVPVALSARTGFQACEVRSRRRYFSTKDTSRVPFDSVASFIPGEELLATVPPTKLRYPVPNVQHREVSARCVSY